MLVTVNVWMYYKDAFRPVPYCKSDYIAIVPKKTLEFQWIAQIRLSLWISLVNLLFRRNISLTVWEMFLTCVKC